MPQADPQDNQPPSPGAAARSDGARLADHDGVARLADELLPALMAKLATTRLGEIEVREGEWRIRLRRPYGVGPGEGRRTTDRPSRSQPGHEGHGHGRAAPESHRAVRAASSSHAGASGATAGTAMAAASNGTNGRGDRNGHGAGPKPIATSPAVGIFQPGSRAASGTRVRAGDALGVVNVLGVPQEVLAPVDGIVGATLVETGTAVEYGQELIRIELAATAEAR